MPAESRRCRRSSVAARECEPGYSPASRRPGSTQYVFGSGLGGSAADAPASGGDCTAHPAQWLLPRFKFSAFELALAIVALGALHARKAREIEGARIAEMRGHYVAQAARDRFEAPGMVALPIVEHLLDRDALQIVLRSAQAAGNDRKGPGTGVTGDVALA